MRVTKYLFTALALVLVISLGLNAQTKYPFAVETVLQKAKSNRVELEKALNYFYKSKDSLKIKAINFLVSNMDIHFSANYYWADSLGKKIAYNELDFPDFDSSIRAFDALKLITPKIHPVPKNYKDIDSIKGEYLIQNTEMAFDDWKQPYAKELCFDDFCEYLLPYRISVEPLQNWRHLYKEHFKYLADSVNGKNIKNAISTQSNDCNQWFTCTYNTEQRKDPLPRLGALQLLHRKKGACEDLAGLGVFESRALGIPATEEIIPYWATSMDSHFFNVAIHNPKDVPFELLSKETTDSFLLPREPGKVFRLTYSKQNEVLATHILTTDIPNGILRTLNYKDVTSKYWETQDVACRLFPVLQKNRTEKKRLVYSCVFNYMGWRPIWWGFINGDSTTFKEMSRGVVYLPMYFDHERLIPAGNPIAVGYHHTQELQPDTINTHTIHIKQQEKYLRFRPGKNYKLLYWSNSWKLIGSKITNDTPTELVFDNVPKNALLLLVPEYSQKKERPFMITDEGERVWW